MEFRILPHCLLLLTAALLVGCGGPTPVAVSGMVTLDGQPLSDGKIVFEPTSKSAGQLRETKIVSGAFDLPASEGVLPGLEFKVLIKSFKKTGRKYPNANMGASYDEMVQVIPAKYNTASTLKIEVTTDPEQNRFNFELSSQESG